MTLTTCFSLRLPPVQLLWPHENNSIITRTTGYAHWQKLQPDEMAFERTHDSGTIATSSRRRPGKITSTLARQASLLQRGTNPYSKRWNGEYFRAKVKCKRESWKSDLALGTGWLWYSLLVRLNFFKTAFSRWIWRSEHGFRENEFNYQFFLSFLFSFLFHFPPFLAQLLSLQASYSFWLYFVLTHVRLPPHEIRKGSCRAGWLYSIVYHIHRWSMYTSFYTHCQNEKKLLLRCYDLFTSVYALNLEEKSNNRKKKFFRFRRKANHIINVEPPWDFEDILASSSFCFGDVPQTNQRLPALDLNLPLE